MLYLVSNDAVLASTDDGETWRVFCARPEGSAIGFVIAGKAQKAGVTMYLALQDKGVFCSTSAGEQWVLLNDGLVDRTISRMAAIGDTVFVGTDSGLYRLDAGVWKRSLVDALGSIYSLVVAEGNLYVSTGPDFRTLQQVESKRGEAAQRMYSHNSSLSRVFRSADLGASWTEITPTDESRPIVAPFGISLSVTGKTILAQSETLFRSRDGGQTWVDLGFEMSPSVLGVFSSVAVNENTFYKVGIFGIHRTTDGGESWHLFMDGMVGTGVLDLVEVNNRFYAHTNRDIVRSTDGGESWSSVRVNTNGVGPKLLNRKDSHLNFSGHSRLAIADNTLYTITPEREDLHVLRLSNDGKALTPIHGVPSFEVDVRSTNNEAPEQDRLSERREEGDDLDALRRRRHEEIGAFAVSGEAFYMEYKRKLFRWRLGDPEWRDTGLVDTGEQPDGDLKCGFRLAVSGATVYIGKRNGRLFQSLDAGSSWKDITLTLPRRFTCFKDIVFAGSTVYIATDAGVLASRTGGHWSVIPDEVVIDNFAVDGSTVYGTGDTGVYRLDAHNGWKQISPVVPGKVLSLVIDRDRLYVVTERRGMFHISLDENNNLSDIYQSYRHATEGVA